MANKNELIEINMRLVAVLLCGAISFFCAYFYDAVVNAGHSLDSHYFFGVAGFLGGMIWSWIVFPKMGRQLLFDAFLILASFPVVGAIAGAFLGGIVMSPITAFSGIVVAVFLPFQFPWPIAVVYLFGALAAFWLPRTNFSK